MPWEAPLPAVSATGYLYLKLLGQTIFSCMSSVAELPVLKVCMAIGNLLLCETSDLPTAFGTWLLFLLSCPYATATYQQSAPPADQGIDMVTEAPCISTGTDKHC